MRDTKDKICLKEFKEWTDVVLSHNALITYCCLYHSTKDCRSNSMNFNNIYMKTLPCFTIYKMTPGEKFGYFISNEFFFQKNKILFFMYGSYVQDLQAYHLQFPKSLVICQVSPCLDVIFNFTSFDFVNLIETRSELEKLT